MANDTVQKDLFRDSGDLSSLVLSLGWLANRDTLAALSSYQTKQIVSSPSSVQFRVCGRGSILVRCLARRIERVLQLLGILRNFKEIV